MIIFRLWTLCFLLHLRQYVVGDWQGPEQYLLHPLGLGVHQGNPGKVLVAVWAHQGGYLPGPGAGGGGEW